MRSHLHFHHHHHHHHSLRRLAQVLTHLTHWKRTQAGDMAVAGEVREHEHGCSARRRRERRPRAWWRHEQFAIRCAVASATHHSAYRPRRVDAEAQTETIHELIVETEYVALAPGCAVPEPTDTFAAPTPVSEYVTASSIAPCAAPAPLIGYVCPTLPVLM